MSFTDKTTVPADLAVMPGDTFVAEAIRRLDLGALIGPREHHVMAQTIYRGVNKSRIWEALLARSESRPIERAPILMTALIRPDDEIVIEEVLIEHAAEDDAIFLEYAFFRLVGRNPEQQEKLQLLNRLQTGELDRHQAISEMIFAARSEGRAPVVATMNGEQAFSLVCHERAERVVLLKRFGVSEYLITEGGLVCAEVEADGIKLHGGLALIGPKKPLRSGLWRMKLDWSQNPDASILVEVTANGGAEKIVQLELVGTTICNIEFRILPEHLVSEVLIHGRSKGNSETWIVRPREVSVAWVSE